jgi:hypothetical protein
MVLYDRSSGRHEARRSFSRILRWVSSLSFAGAFIFVFAQSGLRAEGAEPALALSGFFLLDSSGEQRDQTAEHNARLARFDDIMHDELSKSGRFALVEMKCPQSRCTAQNMTLDQLLQSAKDAGARFLVIGAVEKMSTLVLWARLEVYDVGSRQMVFNRLFTFRGDNDEAWQHAAHYVAKEVIKNAPTPDRQTPTP